jgi:GNAT superfamily N-acetyltransferase
VAVPFPFDLRDATPRDLETLTTLWHEAWRDAHLSLVPAALARVRTVERFRARLLEGLSSVRVAEHRGVAVGFCWVKDDEVYQLFVDAEARGTGVSPALLADGEARIASSGAATAWLTCAIGNHRAARFYEKHGWRRVGTVTSELPTPDGPFPLDVWRYEKALQAAAFR